MTVFLGKPGVGEDRLFVVDAKSGQLLRKEAYADKPLLHRIHNGEFFGDGGLVFAMVRGLVLAVLSASGLVILLDDAAQDRDRTTKDVLVRGLATEDGGRPLCAL